MRLIKKIAGYVNVIAVTAVVTVTLLSGVAMSGVNVKAEETENKKYFYLEDDDTFNKDGHYYIEDEDDIAAFKEYFGLGNSYDNGAMNIFYEDSTLRIDPDKSLYSLDDVYGCYVGVYKLSRDDNGRLIITQKMRVLRADDAAGGAMDGLELDNLLVKWDRNGEKSLNTMCFSELYNNRNEDGGFQWSLTYDKVSNTTVYKDDIDILFIEVSHKVSDDWYEYSYEFAMPDYMIDKTVLNLKKDKSDDTPELNGLCCDENGVWNYYVNGSIDYDYTGLANNEYGWFYVKNGSVDWSYTGLANNEYGWFYVSNGVLDWSYIGLAENEYGWFYVSNGAVDWSYTGLANNEYGWFYVSNGVLDWSYTGLVNNEYGWFYVSNGVLDWSYTGLANNEYGWFYVSNGVVDWDYTGLAENEYGWWYVKNGVLDFSYNGQADNIYGTWNVVNGQVVF